MSWQPLAYCGSFGTLIGGIVSTAFTPFCRAQILKEKRSANAGSPRAPQRASDEDRISSAMRQWTTTRADADLEYTPPPAQAEAPPLEMQGVEPSAPEPVKESADAADESNATIAEPNPFGGLDMQGTPNFYEILQISPRADLETIHRVYRILAARFHPDNPVSGDHERFLQLCRAYEVLSQPQRRMQYDTALQAQETRPIPIFETRIFVDGVDAEMHRRFGVLALLYQRRRTNEGRPGLSAMELEKRMALPREHLEFTLWYLRHKGYVQMLEENSDYGITAPGVDHVEANWSRNRVVRELLIANSPRDAQKATKGRPARRKRGDMAVSSCK
jgi:curved DNA-binding protein CbpA